MLSRLWYRVVDSLLSVVKEVNTRVEEKVDQVCDLVVQSRVWQENVSYPPVKRTLSDASTSDNSQVVAVPKSRRPSLVVPTQDAVAKITIKLKLLMLDAESLGVAEPKTYLVIRHLNCFDHQTEPYSGTVVDFHEMDDDRVTIQVPIMDIVSDVVVLVYAVNKVASDHIVGYVILPATSLQHQLLETPTEFASFAMSVFPFQKGQTTDSLKYVQALRKGVGVPKPDRDLGVLHFNAAIEMGGSATSLLQAYARPRYTNSLLEAERKESVQQILFTFSRLGIALNKLVGRYSPLMKTLVHLHKWESPLASLCTLVLMYHVCFSMAMWHIPFLVAVCVVYCGYIDSCSLRDDYPIWRQLEAVEDDDATRQRRRSSIAVVIKAQSRKSMDLMRTLVQHMRMQLPLPLLELEEFLFRGVSIFRAALPSLRHPLITVDLVNDTSALKKAVVGASERAKREMEDALEDAKETVDDIAAIVKAAQELKKQPTTPTEEVELTIIQKAAKTKYKLDQVDGFLSKAASAIERTVNLWNFSDPNVTPVAYAVLAVVCVVLSMLIMVMQYVFENVVSPNVLCFTGGLLVMVLPSGIVLPALPEESEFAKAAAKHVRETVLEPVSCVLQRTPDEMEMAHRSIARRLDVVHGEACGKQLRDGEGGCNQVSDEDHVEEIVDEQ